MIQGLLVLDYPSYVYKPWHGTLLSLFISTYLAPLLPQFELSVLVIHVLGFFCILIPLVVFAAHGSISDMFLTFTNGGGWSFDGLSFFTGLSTSQFAFLGVDAASHMGKCLRSSILLRLKTVGKYSGRNRISLEGDLSKYDRISGNKWDLGICNSRCNVVLPWKRRSNDIDSNRVSVPCHI